MPPVYSVLDQCVGSDGRTVYEIRRGGDAVVYCTCHAWRMKQGRASCKHLDAYLVRRQRHRAGPREELSSASLADGNVVEVNSRGVVFLLRVTGIGPSAHSVRGIQLLDPDQPKTSLRGEREVAVMDIVRVVVRTRGARL